MNPDMKIAIACADATMKKLAYELLPAVAPQDITGAYETIHDLLKANNEEPVDVVIMDEGFSRRDMASGPGTWGPLGRLRLISVPVVALMPRAPSYASTVTLDFGKIVIKTMAVGLDLPTTAQGMQAAILRAIDNRERVGASSGPDYGRDRVFPATSREAPAFRAPDAAPEAPARDDTEPPTPDLDPVDALIEAAKAIVRESERFGPAVTFEATKLLIEALKTALDRAGYGV